MNKNVIRSHKNMSQVIDFSNMRFGNIMPTDIDGLIEYRDMGFMLYEVKYDGAEMPFGQRLALERLTDALQMCRPTLLMLCSHLQTDDKDIDLANTIVVEYRFKGGWHIPVTKINAYTMTNEFIKKIERGLYDTNKR